MKKLIIPIFILFFSLAIVSSETIGTFKKDSDVEIYQTCNNCTYCFFTKIKSETELFLTNVSALQDGTYYYYNFSGNTTELGTYTYCYACGNSVENVTGCLNFEVSIHGEERVNQGEGFIILAGVIVILFLSGIFFILGFKTKNTVLKVVFFGFGGLMVFIAILFSMVSITESLSNYPNFLQGYSTFLMVVRILALILILSLLIYGGLVALKLWKIKRGFIDG